MARKTVKGVSGLKKKSGGGIMKRVGKATADYLMSGKAGAKKKKPVAKRVKPKGK